MVYSNRLAKFITLQFRPWPLAGLSEEKKKEVKKNINSISEKYREQQERAEMLKHIDEIRTKLAAIEAYRARREQMRQRVQELDQQRKQLYGLEEELVEV